MYPWTLGGLLLCWCKCFFPWFCHDYWLELEPEYWNLFKYVVTSPEEHKSLIEKAPKRNFKQLCWESAKHKIEGSKSTERVTPDLVQWIHKEELIRMLDNEKAGRGKWRSPRPPCWKIPWKCIFIFTRKNKYGRFHYSIVDVCTLEHVDGVENELYGWPSKLIQVLKEHKPLRMYVTNDGPFDVVNKGYYVTASVCGFIEIYLRLEQELEELLLWIVWPVYLFRVTYKLDNLQRYHYDERSLNDVRFNGEHFQCPTEATTYPTKLSFLEKPEDELDEWVYSELETFKKWKKKKMSETSDVCRYLNKNKIGRRNASLYRDFWRKRRLNYFGSHRHTGSLSSSLAENNDGDQDEAGTDWYAFRSFLRSLNMRRYTIKRAHSSTNNNSVRRTYSEFLWKREKYLSEVEKTSVYFPKVLNFKFSEGEDSFLLSCSKEEVDIYLKYQRYWKNWKPLQIFDNEGKLLRNPAKELNRIVYKKQMEAKYEEEIETLKKMPKTRRGVLFSEVGLPKHLQNLHFKLRRKVEKESILQTWRKNWRHFLYGEDHEIDAYKYWKERRDFVKTRPQSDWSNREVDRRNYTSSLEWFQYKYPNICIEPNEKWRYLTHEEWLSEKYLLASETTEGRARNDIKMVYVGPVSGKPFILTLNYDYEVEKLETTRPDIE